MKSGLKSLIKALAFSKMTWKRYSIHSFRLKAVLPVTMKVRGLGLSVSKKIIEFASREYSC